MHIHRSEIAMRLKPLIIGLALALAAGPGQASTLFQVDGDRSSTAPIGSGAPDKGAAQTFEVAQTIENVGFAVDLTCFSCEGELWLISGRMSPTATIFQQVASASYSGWSGAQSALTGLTLVPDTYTLILTMTTGNGGWQGTTAPTITGNVIAAESGYSVLSSIDPNFVPWSSTRPVSGATLKFTVTGNVVGGTIPLPASLPLLFAAIAGLGLVRRGRARAA